MIIAVAGSTGMLGSMVMRYLKEKGHTVVGFSRKVLEGYTDEILDVHNSQHLSQLYGWIKKHKPAAIIDCIGLLVKDSQDNPAEAAYLNSYFPHLLENMTKGTKTKVIYISTDCIFNGEALVYHEDDLPTETNYYGRSKTLGELNNDKDLTLRQSIIGPAPQANNTGLFNWLITQKEELIKGYGLVQWNGLTTLELAKHIENILLNHSELHGIYQLVPEAITISKYNLLGLIRDIWDLPVGIQADNSVISNKILVNTRTDYPAEIPDYETQLEELYDYMNKHNIEVGHIK